MRCGVIDLGSNTFHALVADIANGEIRTRVFEDKIAVRIGEHAFANQWIDRDACARGIGAMGLLLSRVRATSCDALKLVATGVFREARNGDQFLAAARDAHGVEITLLDGNEEARLTWTAVAAELGADRSRLAVVDLGGGSCEIALGERSLAASRSLPLGVLRLRHLSAADTRAIVRRVAATAIDDLRAFAPHEVALSSGTARALLRIARRLGFVPPLARDLPAHTLGGLASLLGSLSPSALGAIGVSEARRDTIATGAVVFDTIVRTADIPRVRVAQTALREGVLESMATPPSTRGEEFAAT